MAANPSYIQLKGLTTMASALHVVIMVANHVAKSRTIYVPTAKPPGRLIPCSSRPLTTLTRTTCEASLRSRAASCQRRLEQAVLKLTTLGGCLKEGRCYPGRFYKSWREFRLNTKCKMLPFERFTQISRSIVFAGHRIPINVVPVVGHLQAQLLPTVCCLIVGGRVPLQSHVIAWSRFDSWKCKQLLPLGKEKESGPV